MPTKPAQATRERTGACPASLVVAPATTRYVPLHDGTALGATQLTLPQLAQHLASAHRRGWDWDVRVATGGQGCACVHMKRQLLWWLP
jgi:hypothetical protein